MAFDPYNDKEKKKKTMKKVKKVLKAPKMKISENEKRKLFFP